MVEELVGRMNPVKVKASNPLMWNKYTYTSKYRNKYTNINFSQEYSGLE